MVTSLRLGLAFVSIGIFNSLANAGEGDWSEGAKISPHGRANPFELSENELARRTLSGKLDTLVYPVEITGVLLPYRPIVTMMEDKKDNPIKVMLRGLFRNLSGFKSMDDVYNWLGLNVYPTQSDSGIYSVPYPNGARPDYRMGVTLIDTPKGTGLTFSCATCHSSRLFGKSVLGLTNKVTKANEFFIVGKSAAGKTDLNLFRYLSNADDGEMEMLERAKKNLRFIDAKSAEVLGLDTSLAHTALSLSRRGNDPYAKKSLWNATFPRHEPLRDLVADSKPAPWWNVKFKNRWLLDGSVVSGNPIFTNILWNEIGRGTDLVELEQWLQNNRDTVTNLTTAVFNTEAPRYTDFFDASGISLESAKRGETLFNENCARCHGSYQKAWSQANAAELSISELLKTVRVMYHERTPVINVGTDPNRYLGMKSLAVSLNRLAISQKNNIKVTPQQGYVPPPLVGIWARWPYFHNNSAPTLCAVLTRASERPKKFYTGPANDRATEFDAECNGYPTGERTPKEWTKREEALLDTRKPGLGNAGHDEGIFLDDGQELFSPEQKRDLIEFLKTL